MTDRISTSKPLGLGELASVVQGVLLNPREGTAIVGLTTLDEARPGMASFAASAKHAAALETTQASIVLLPPEIDPGERMALRVDDVWLAVKRLLEYFYPAPAPDDNIHASACIHRDVEYGICFTAGPGAVVEEDARIGDNVTLGANCYVGENVKIGDNTTLHPNVVVLRDCEIGANVTIFPNATIGADGYKYELIGGVPTKIPQIGKVVLEDDVEIGANTTIDRASFTATRIGRGTKIDNLVQIAHNCKIGRYCMIVAQVGIAGSTEIGDGCILAGQVGLADNIKLGNKVTLAAQSGVMHDIPDGETWFGSPAQPIAKTMKMLAVQRKLPELQKAVRELQKRQQDG